MAVNHPDPAAQFVDLSRLTPGQGLAMQSGLAAVTGGVGMGISNGYNSILPGAAGFGIAGALGEASRHYLSQQIPENAPLALRMLPYALRSGITLGGGMKLHDLFRAKDKDDHMDSKQANLMRKVAAALEAAVKAPAAPAAAKPAAKPLAPKAIPAAIDPAISRQRLDAKSPIVAKTALLLKVAVALEAKAKGTSAQEKGPKGPGTGK